VATQQEKLQKVVGEYEQICICGLKVGNMASNPNPLSQDSAIEICGHRIATDQNPVSGKVKRPPDLKTNKQKHPDREGNDRDPASSQVFNGE
jgi:hypothetical protein